MDAATRTQVRERAADGCEYCGVAQQDEYFTLHVEHIVARQHGCSDSSNNLTLACQHCNRHKGPNLSGIDSETGQVVPLFNPRTDRWVEHFRLAGPTILGLTALGRATVRVLAMIDRDRVELRSRTG